MTTGVFANVEPRIGRDLTEHYVKIDVRLAIDGMIRDLLDAGHLRNTRDADDLRKDLYTPAHCGFALNVIERLDEFPARNSIRDIMNFFSTEKKPVTNDEINIFWGSLSPADRMFYFLVPLY